MNKFVPILAFSIFLHPLAAEFRGYSWGSSKAEMIAKNGKAVEVIDATNAEYLGYDIKINNHPYRAYFNYSSNKLVAGMTLYTEPMIVPEQYIVEYETIFRLLEEKYGLPKTDDRTIIGNPEDQSVRALSLQNGRGMYMSVWETKDTKISLILRGGSGKLILRIVYEPLQQDVQQNQQTNSESKQEL